MHGAEKGDHAKRTQHDKLTMRKINEFRRIIKHGKAYGISKRAAWIVGIPSKLMVMMAFGLSTAMGGLAGVIIAPITMSSYDMGTMLGLKGFCAAMLGGLGSLWGALIGGFLLGILEALGVGFVSSGLKDATAFLLLLFILYVRPGGIISSADVNRF